MLEKYETLIKEVHESKVDLGYAPPSESTANEAASSVLALDDGTLPRESVGEDEDAEDSEDSAEGNSRRRRRLRRRLWRWTHRWTVC